MMVSGVTTPECTYECNTTNSATRGAITHTTVGECAYTRQCVATSAAANLAAATKQRASPASAVATATAA